MTGRDHPIDWYIKKQSILITFLVDYFNIEGDELYKQIPKLFEKKLISEELCKKLLFTQNEIGMIHLCKKNKLFNDMEKIQIKNRLKVIFNCYIPLNNVIVIFSKTRNKKIFLEDLLKIK